MVENIFLQLNIKENAEDGSKGKLLEGQKMRDKQRKLKCFGYEPTKKKKGIDQSVWSALLY